VLTEVAGRLGHSPSQIALAWTLARPGMTAPIFGATSVSHVDEAVAALDIVLPREEIARIDAAYAARPISGAGH
jgi:aryl-alcohol dehydrogenase-like predicted oxidoreductase